MDLGDGYMVLELEFTKEKEVERNDDGEKGNRPVLNNTSCEKKRNMLVTLTEVERRGGVAPFSGVISS